VEFPRAHDVITLKRHECRAPSAKSRSGSAAEERHHSILPRIPPSRRNNTPVNVGRFLPKSRYVFRGLKFIAQLLKVLLASIILCAILIPRSVLACWPMKATDVQSLRRQPDAEQINEPEKNKPPDSALTAAWSTRPTHSRFRNSKPETQNP
jgi:hypothetical protein